MIRFPAPHTENRPVCVNHEASQVPLEPVKCTCEKYSLFYMHIHGKDATIRQNIIDKHGISGPEQYVWHRTPGFGDSNWTDIISELRRFGYRGNIDIEGWHDPVYRGKLEMTGQVHALNYLKHCRGGAYIDW